MLSCDFPPATRSAWETPKSVMPHLKGQGRLPISMRAKATQPSSSTATHLLRIYGATLTPSGADRYDYEEQRDYLFALWDKLKLGDRVVLIIPDWGSALGFDWAMQHPRPRTGCRLHGSNRRADAMVRLG